MASPVSEPRPDSGHRILVGTCSRVLRCLGASAVAGVFVCLSHSAGFAQEYPYTDVWAIPTTSLYGGVGLIEMRNARFMPDGYFWIAGTLKSPDDRIDINFQPTPWLETTFRYTINYALAPEGQRALYDRSFDFKLRLWQETPNLPQVALGLQDFIGTGVYSAEYLVASKRFGPIDATLGLGWGRLASRSTFKNPFCVIYSSFCVRPGDVNQTGGSPLLGSYFRGPDVGLFGGLEYKTPIPDLTFKLEYSSDAYTAESTYIQPGQPVKGHVFTNYAPVPVNAELSYRLWSNVDVGFAYMYGRVAEVNLDFRMNPSEPNWDARVDQQPPFVPRPPTEANSDRVVAMMTAHPDDGLETWRTHFVDLTQLPTVDQRPADPAMATTRASQNGDESGKPAAESLATALARARGAIEDQGLRVDSIDIRKNTLRVEIENPAYLRDAEGISRTLRVLSATAPADIDVFQVTTALAHMPLTTVTVPRSQLDALGEHTSSPAEIWESTIFSDAAPSTRYGPEEGYPRLLWALLPRVREQLFDPDNPIFVGVGAGGSAHLELVPGLTIDGDATYNIWNDFGSITRPSNSVLPHVRSDLVKYLQHGFSGVNDLSVSYYAKIAPEIYTRATAGYLEDMFGGYGGEVLYRPFGQRWAIGADLYEAYQRNWDELFGFGHYNYHVLTGHASLYVETPWNGMTAVVRLGRYLAGDFGGTLELYRRFDTGIEIGAWATITNVPFSKFGEGSFDKGIKIVIPMEWVLPFGTTTNYELDLRPIQRDGGQALSNDAALFDATQSSSYGDLQQQWPHVFQ